MIQQRGAVIVCSKGHNSFPTQVFYRDGSGFHVYIYNIYIYMFPYPVFTLGWFIFVPMFFAKYFNVCFPHVQAQQWWIFSWCCRESLFWYSALTQDPLKIIGTRRSNKSMMWHASHSCNFIYFDDWANHYIFCQDSQDVPAPAVSHQLFPTTCLPPNFSTSPSWC